MLPIENPTSKSFKLADCIPRRLHSSPQPPTFLSNAAFTTADSPLSPLHHPLLNTHLQCKANWRQNTGIAIPLPFRKKLRWDCLRLLRSSVLHIWPDLQYKCPESSRVRDELEHTTATIRCAKRMGILHHDIRRDRPDHRNIYLQLLLRRCKHSRCGTSST